MIAAIRKDLITQVLIVVVLDSHVVVLESISIAIFVERLAKLNKVHTAKLRELEDDVHLLSKEVRTLAKVGEAKIMALRDLGKVRHFSAWTGRKRRVDVIF